jgi:hypothetical protein
LAGGCRAAQHGAHPRRHLAQLERLRGVVVVAALQAHDPVDGVALPCHHHDGHHRARTDLAADSEAVAIRQVEVERDEIECARGQAFQRLGARARLGQERDRPEFIYRSLQGDDRRETRGCLDHADRLAWG